MIKPILFNIKMVRAILDGRKTVTRRVVKTSKYIPENAEWGYSGFTPEGHISVRGRCWINGEERYGESFIKRPYQTGDILYVRETWHKDVARYMYKVGKLKNCIDWYIKGKYHCDKCPYCWSTYSYDGDEDCGCYLKGDIHDTCRYIRNPISRMIVNKRMCKEEHYYDDLIESYKQADIVIEKIQQDFEKNPYGKTWYKLLRESNLDGDSGLEATLEFSGVISDAIETYKKLYYPHLSPGKKLKQAFKEWLAYIKEWHFDCYFTMEKRRKK